jgi:ribonuclease-3
LADTDRILDAVENLLGYTFNDPALLLQALMHRSYINEQGLPLIESNERLEFLGDSVIELAVTHVLFEDFPDYPEGELTKLRSPLVKGAALADAADKMGLGDYVLLGKGEEGIYLDGGFGVACGMVLSCLGPLIHDIVKWGSGDFKSELQELSTKRTGAVPRYRMKEEGPDHFKTFHATVEVNDRKYGPVAGSSKKEAEQGAARAALIKLGWSTSGKKKR